MKLLKIGVVVVLLLNLTGCWSKVELDELTFVYGLFIDVDKEPGMVEVTINTPLPNRLSAGGQPGSTGGGGEVYATVSKTAKTITDAIILIQQDLTRELSLSQLKVVVLGEAYAREGISEILEWIKKEPSLSLSTYIMTSSGHVKELNQISAMYEQLPAEILRKLASEDHMFATTIKDCLFAESAGLGFAMNYLFLGRTQETSGMGKPDLWVGIQGAALFQKDKMKGTIKDKEGRALAWAEGNLKNSSYSVTWDEEESAATAMFVKTKVSKSIAIINKEPVFTVKLIGRASITYLKDSKNRDQVSLRAIILEKLKEEITADLTGAIKSSQKVGADILQLGLLLEWNDPKRWNQIKERWDGYYTRDAEIKVKTELSIQDFGTGK
jgi:spore germination protein KC